MISIFCYIIFGNKKRLKKIAIAVELFLNSGNIIYAVIIAGNNN